MRWSSPFSISGWTRHMDQAVEQRVATAFVNLQEAIEEYFAAKATYVDQRHDDECDDPLCNDRQLRDKATPESLSSFVVLAELTAMTTDGGSVLTHADRCFHGSAMSVLGLITDAQWSLIREGH